MMRRTSRRSAAGGPVPSISLTRSAAPFSSSSCSMSRRSITQVSGSAPISARVYSSSPVRSYGSSRYSKALSQGGGQGVGVSSLNPILVGARGWDLAVQPPQACPGCGQSFPKLSWRSSRGTRRSCEAHCSTRVRSARLISAASGSVAGSLASTSTTSISASSPPANATIPHPGVCARPTRR